MKYHVVVAGARPAKGPDNKYLPIPAANVEFIHNVLAMLPAGDYAAVYHGAAKGIDEVVANWCVAHQVPQKQFPAYWQDWNFQSNQFERDDYAAAKRTRQMLRAAKDAVYDATTPNHIKANEGVIFLGFGNPDPQDTTKAIIDDDLKFILDQLGRLKNSPYQLTTEGNHRVLALPVSMVPTVPATSTQVVNVTGQPVTVTPFG